MTIRKAFLKTPAIPVSGAAGAVAGKFRTFSHTTFQGVSPEGLSGVRNSGAGQQGLPELFRYCGDPEALSLRDTADYAHPVAHPHGFSGRRAGRPWRWGLDGCSTWPAALGLPSSVVQVGKRREASWSSAGSLITPTRSCHGGCNPRIGLGSPGAPRRWAESPLVSSRLMS